MKVKAISEPLGQNSDTVPLIIQFYSTKSIAKLYIELTKIKEKNLRKGRKVMK